MIKQHGEQVPRMKIHNNKNPPEIICQEKKQTSITSYFAVPVPPKQKQGRGHFKKEVAVQVEKLGNNSQHQEETPPAPVKK
jgi:hypothetical protein